MKRFQSFFFLSFLLCAMPSAKAQSDSIPVVGPNNSRCNVLRALDAESLFPMFLTGGYHFAVGYRYQQFRVRLSVINGGRYDAETAGVNNNSANFKRYYLTSPGIFLGYYLWRNLEAYTYFEFHTFRIEQKSTGLSKRLHSLDSGLGCSYQFFIGKHCYVQPGMHLYLRSDHQLNFENQIYHIPHVDISPVIRIGYRIWSNGNAAPR